MSGIPPMLPPPPPARKRFTSALTEEAVNDWLITLTQTIGTTKRQEEGTVRLRGDRPRGLIWRIGKLPIRYQKASVRLPEILLLCDRLLANHRAFCSHEECRLRGITPKRAQDLMRISVHSISIAPQFDIILKRAVDSLISVHRRIHNLDHVLVNTASWRTDIAQTSAHMHVLTRLKLPDDTVLSHLNLTKRWTIAASPPFKEKDLKSLMTQWKTPARVDKHDHVTHCTDFARMYFATACDPVKEVKKYAVRVLGKHAKDPRKMDLPANIRDTLIKCFLDCLKMGQPELDRMPDELAAQPTQKSNHRFWSDLGPTNESGATKLLEKQATGDAWISALKSTLGRALNNVRQYVKKGNALVP
ncbi:unnamed protein product [Heligmosomoides polygyrus]|uniref:PH domain-containing protein n=1 Tax=Heligmosomoides polygyrus TaxID=6339 RepID=A0A183GIB2_HELPZ|nr:unnamed protein product [Heligmosomoides polygyrus]